MGFFENIFGPFLAQQPISDLIYSFFLPFIITFAIFWGVLSMMKFFNKRINLVLAFALTLAAAGGGLFNFYAQYLLVLGPVVAVGAFIIVFVVGTVIWAYGRGKDIYYGTDPERRMEKINRDIEKMSEKWRNEADPAKKRALDNNIFELYRERDRIRREIQGRRY